MIIEPLVMSNSSQPNDISNENTTIDNVKLIEATFEQGSIPPHLPVPLQASRSSLKSSTMSSESQTIIQTYHQRKSILLTKEAIECPQKEKTDRYGFIIGDNESFEDEETSSSSISWIAQKDREE
jgi:hypothetical protein